MSDRLKRWALTLSMAALAFAALASGARDFAPEAQAQEPPPTAVCRAMPIGLTMANVASAQEGWMNEQLRAGKSHFVSVSNLICAW